jgi:hypothetical protein
VFLKGSLISALFLLPAMAMAGEIDAPEQNLLLPTFQFQHQSITLGSSPSREGLPAAGSRQLYDSANSTQGQVNQYDAMITYPFGQRDQAVNFDLGVNIRFIEAGLRNQDLDKTEHLNMALPMLHATALFNLPFKGLTASVGGSHTEYEQYRAYDYKARLNYSWDNGFGLEGGWQHQQFSIDGSDSQTRFETQGPYLDLKYRF